MGEWVGGVYSVEVKLRLIIKVVGLSCVYIKMRKLSYKQGNEG